LERKLGDRWIDDVAAGIGGEFRRRLKRLAGAEEAEDA